MKYNVLYVDDEKINLSGFELLFRKKFNIITASSGQQGLEILKAQPIHVIITDQRMPDMMGVDFLKKVKDKWPDIKYILLTAFDDKEVVKRAVNEIGIFWYVNKPFDNEQMEQIIIKAINSYLTENKLRESEKKFRDVFNTMVDVFARSDLDGNCLLLSPSVFNVMGYVPEEIVGRNYAEFYTRPKDWELLNKRLLETGSVQSYESDVNRKDGRQIIISSNAKVVQDNSGQPLYIESVFRDITKRKRTEKELKESEKKFRDVFNSISDVFSRRSLDGKIEILSPSINNLTGYKMEDLIGQDVSKFYVDPNQTELLKEQVLKNGKVENFETDIFRKDGKILTISINSNIHYNKEGKPSGIDSVFRDITLQKETENNLKESEEKYRLLVNNSLVGVFITTMDARLLYANDAMAQMFEYDNAEQLIAAGPLTLWKEPKLREAAATLIKKNGVITNFEVETITCNNRGVRVILSAKIQGDTISGMVMDITGLKQAQDQLIQSERRLTEAQQMAKVGNWEWDIKNDLFIGSDEALRIYGFKPKSKISYEKLMQVIHPDDHEFHNEKKARWIENRGGNPFEYRVVYSNGVIRHVSVSGKIVCDTTNEPIKLIGSVQDITDRKNTEDERNRLFNLSVDLIAITGFDGYFKDINPAWTKILGYSKEELLSNPFSDFIHPDDYQKTINEVGQLLEEGRKTINFQNRYIHKNGNIIDLSWAATPMPEEGLMYGIARDVTEQKQIDREILEYQVRLQKLAKELTVTEEKVRKQIAIDLHDDVGQLLSSIRMQLSRIIDLEGNPELITRMSGISKALLRAAQSTRAAIFDLSPPQLNEIGLFAAVHDWAKEQIERKHQIITTLAGENEIFELEENTRYLLFRSVRELAVNVLKHGKASSLHIKFERVNQNLEITVEDDGVGFNYNPKLLKLKGNTFGLFSIQERMSDLGGLMKVDSMINKGTIIKLVAPIKN